MPLSSVVNIFAGGPLERGSERRADVERIAGMAADPGARWLVLSGGRLQVESGPVRLARRARDQALALAQPGTPELFLAVSAAGPVFAVEAADEAADAYADLRVIAADLSEEDAALAATALSVFGWHARHRFCANCGGPTKVTDAGWKRVCEACAAQHFPRTDPVVIMLALNGDRCLLGRNASWPEGRYSALAGFLEPGESIEAACARELKEESGLTAVRVTYHSNQPWPLSPLGGQLMIGLFAEVADGEAVADGTELAEVRWVTREEARAVLAGAHPEVKAPPAMAIAHQLLKGWVEG